MAKKRLNVHLEEYEITAFKAWCDDHNREYSATIGSLIHQLITQKRTTKRVPTEVVKEPQQEESMPIPQEYHEEESMPIPQEYPQEYRPEHYKTNSLKKRRPNQ